MTQKLPRWRQHSSSVCSLRVDLGERSYHILIGASLLEQAGRLIRSTLGNGTHRLAIISNHTIFKRYGPPLKASLEAHEFRVSSYLMGDGERYKTLSTVESICRSLARRGCHRQSSIIALGGGVIGDVSGFVAASFLRGIPLIQMPTTFLAAIDSSVGGKTGVNVPEGKNLIGAFYQPRLVLTDTSLLQSLPLRELRAGLYEALKYGIIADADLFESICRMTEDLPPLSDAQWPQLISRCCQIKADVVAADEREAGHRQILNFGHTFGHATESLTEYRRFKHGEAVGYGLILATRLALRLGKIDPQIAARIEAAVRSVGSLPPVDDLPIDAWIDRMRWDKKVRGDQSVFVLPTDIGAVDIVTDVPPQIVRRTIEDFIASDLNSSARATKRHN